MSVKAVSWALDDVQGIHPTRKLVLIVMAEAAHSDGTASFVSANTIAEKTGIDVRSVRRHIKALHQDGFISKGDQRHTAFLPAQYRPTVWNMNISDSQRLKAMTRNALSAIPRGDTHGTPRGDTHGTPRGDTHVTSRGDTGGRSGVTPGVTPVSPKPGTKEQTPTRPEVEEVLPSCSICGRGRETLYGGGVCSDCIEPQPQAPHPRRPHEGWAAAIKADIQRKRQERESQATGTDTGGHIIHLPTFNPAEDKGHST